MEVLAILRRAYPEEFSKDEVARVRSRLEAAGWKPESEEDES